MSGRIGNRSSRPAMRRVRLVLKPNLTLLNAQMSAPEGPFFGRYAHNRAEERLPTHEIAASVPAGDLESFLAFQGEDRRGVGHVGSVRHQSDVHLVEGEQGAAARAFWNGRLSCSSEGLLW